MVIPHGRRLKVQQLLVHRLHPVRVRADIRGDRLDAFAWQIAELTWQLRGQAGARQVPGAKVGLAQTNGLGGNATAAILKR